MDGLFACCRTNPPFLRKLNIIWTSIHFFGTLRITPHRPASPFVPLKDLLSSQWAIFFIIYFFSPVCNTQTRARAHKHSVHTKDKCSYADELSGSGLTQTQAITMAAVDDVKVFWGLLCTHVGSRSRAFFASFDSLGQRHAAQWRAFFVPA